MQTTNFCGHEITRLILGDNPFNGYTCIAFKIFAGGQVFHGKPESETPNIIKEVYREVFSKLKPCDVAAIGVYQGRKNQIEENVRLFEEICC